MDNTLIIYIQGDNGASGEGTHARVVNEVGVAANGVEETEEYLLSIMDDLGGPLTYNHYPVGWAHAMDTPFQWTKQVASHFGGTRNGHGHLLARTHQADKGGIRTQFSSVIDITPTHSGSRRCQPADDDQRREAEAHRRHEPHVYLR